MKKLVGISGMGIAAIVFAVSLAMMPPSTGEPSIVTETTYKYKPGAMPPPMAIAEYSHKFVDTVEEASAIVGYEVQEPKFEKGTKMQLIGIYDDRIVQIYASSNKITTDTTDLDFFYALDGVVVHYEKPLVEQDLPSHVKRWAEKNNASSEKTNNGREEAVKGMYQGVGHDREIVDMPGKLVTEKNGIKIIVKGFLNHGQLQRIVANF